MKKTIFSFDQKLAVEKGLDVSDLLLLEYIMYALARPTMIHVGVKNDSGNEILYVWLKHSKIKEDLPILRWSEDTLCRRLQNLVSLNLLAVETRKNERHRGTRCYYTITKDCENLLYSKEEDSDDTKQEENDQSAKQGIGHDDQSANEGIGQSRPIRNSRDSDNKLNSKDKELNRDKELDNAETAFTTSQSKSISIDKPKKVNAYDKCALEIQNEKYKFTDEVKEKLIEYLPIRMNKTTQPFSISGWASILRKLTKLSKDENIQIKIIQKSINGKWASFFELDDSSDNYKQHKINKFGEDENVNANKITEEEKVNGYFSGETF